MKVIRKEPREHFAYKWQGKNEKDYYSFLEASNIHNFFWDAEYNFIHNEINLKVAGRGEKIIRPNQYIVFDDGLEVLSEKEFKEQYEVVE